MKNENVKKAIRLWAELFLIAILLVVVTTLAWFVLNKSVSIESPSDENLAVFVNSGDLEISLSYLQDDSHLSPYSPYANHITVLTPQITYIDVTGNGNSLWNPEELSTGDEPDFNEPDNFLNVTDQPGYCITILLKFKTAEACDIYLDKQSFIRGLEDILGSSLARESNYGPFSRDGIAGAARVAFFSNPVISGDTVLDATFVNMWIPNDKYELDYTYGSNSAAFSIDGAREESYEYWIKQNGAMTQHIFTSEEYAGGMVTVGAENLADQDTQTINNAFSLLSFEGGEVEEKELLVRIWFEGTDRESRVPVDGGMVKYKLVFDSIAKTPATAQAKVETIKSVFRNNKTVLVYGDDSSCEGEIIYSYNGIDWTQYGYNHPSLDRNNYYGVFVKSKETESEKMSTVKWVPFN